MAPGAGPAPLADLADYTGLDDDEPTRQLPEVSLGGPPGTDEDGGPVFVDSSGRRRRKLRRIGWILGAGCAGYAAVLVYSLLGGNAGAPWLLIPGADDDKPRDAVVTSPEKGAGAEGGAPAPATGVAGAGATSGPDASESGRPGRRASAEERKRDAKKAAPGKGERTAPATAGAKVTPAPRPVTEPVPDRDPDPGTEPGPAPDPGAGPGPVPAESASSTPEPATGSPAPESSQPAPQGGTS
ncbi:hypothetical protein ABT112_29895 [Streptomyces sp. NPDC002055]|uniref:hypothetical protein n=1 Tax=Streptomyces sp. NPDC002055 TaxID=3154534 RepID=UPI003319B36F